MVSICRIFGLVTVRYHTSTDETIEYLGLGQRPPDYEPRTKDHWDYTSFSDTPVDLENVPWAASVYRGLVPAKNILNRDFAINGATVLCFRLSAHTLSSPVNSLRPTTRIFLRSRLIGSHRISVATSFGFQGA